MQVAADEHRSPARIARRIDMGAVKDSDPPAEYRGVDGGWALADFDRNSNPADAATANRIDRRRTERVNRATYRMTLPANCILPGNEAITFALNTKEEIHNVFYNSYYIFVV